MIFKLQSKIRKHPFSRLVAVEESGSWSLILTNSGSGFAH